MASETDLGEYTEANPASLGEYVRSGVGDDDFVASCWLQAQALVRAWVGATTTVPAPVLDRAFLEVGSELYHRRQAPNGIAQFSGFDGSAVRVARDPMVGAYPILSQYVGLGFA